MKQPSIRNCAWLTISVALMASHSGCGSDGPQRYRMSGAVTFEGKPVPSGMVSFEPTAKGIGGGYAPIVDGTYDTDLTGRGHLGGEHKVMIAGFDGVQGDIMDPDAMAIPMFDVITFTEDLPIESTTVDFALPLDLVDAAP